ncbi:hypothetical protein CXG81DRAFT_14836, partial [Caulochytrium protostelioides]
MSFSSGSRQPARATSQPSSTSTSAPLPQGHAKSSVHVVVRTRPSSFFAQDVIQFAPDRRTVNVHVAKNDAGFINNQPEDWAFHVDNIFHNASQEALYQDAAFKIVQNALQGINGTIIAYGQTGSGKTFTTMGTPDNFQQRGIIPRTIQHVFREMADKPHNAYTVRMSFLEIYNEQLYDLLADSKRLDVGNELHVPQDEHGRSSVTGLTVVPLRSEHQAFDAFFTGNANRTTAEHQMNAASSRSHAVFTLLIEMRSKVESNEKITFSKLNIVDLAGSERLSETQTSGRLLDEAKFINKSLTFLEQVIMALGESRRGHVPFRQSRLTAVLRDALGGNSETLLIANIHTERRYIDETISTLRFTSRMMKVTNSPAVNVQYDQAML